MKRIICFLKSIYYTLSNPKCLKNGYISGHSFRETFNGVRNGRIEQDLVCEVCGKKETGWE